MSIALTLALAVAVADERPNAVVVQETVLSAPRQEIERVLFDVQHWPAIFRDIERVDDVRAERGVVRARVASSTTGLRHDVEVRWGPDGISWCVDGDKGFVDFEIVELKRGASTRLVVRARTHIYGAVKVVLSDEEIEKKLRTVVQADVADLESKFGAVNAAAR